MSSEHEDGDPAADADLVGAARRGASGAFSALVRRHQARVRSYVALYVRDAAAADDVAQEAFLRAYRGLATFDERRAFRPWVVGIARNCVLEHLRAEVQARAGSRPEIAALLDAEYLARIAADRDPAVREYELAALRRCLDRLPPGGASVVVGHYLEGKTLASIAAASGRNENTVRGHLLRLRQALRDCVQRRLAGERADA